MPDPTNPQSYNRFSYVRNNPVNFTDPTGHRECGGPYDSACATEPFPSSIPTSTNPVVDTSQSWEGLFLWRNPIHTLDANNQQTSEATVNDFFTIFYLQQLSSNEQNAFLSNPSFGDNAREQVSSLLVVPSSMNCWESILYAAVASGTIDSDWVFDFYDQVWSSNDPNMSVWEQLGSFDAESYDPTAIQPGQLVFFTGENQNVPGHVALSTGNNNVMSLWSLPDNNWTLQATTVDAVVESMGKSITVSVADAPWDK